MPYKDEDKRRRYIKEYKKRHKSDKKYYEAHKEKIKKYFKEYMSKNPDKKSLWNRKSAYKKRYNLTIDDYQKMFDAQDGYCKICQEPSKVGARKGLNVDHDHVTGRVRGLLCKRCNSILGLVDDRQELLHEAIEYLKNSNTGHVTSCGFIPQSKNDPPHHSGLDQD